ncbi:tocopherol cyclase family protein [Paraconexibacter sp. AEG42_29]
MGGMLSRYRATGADLPFGDPLRAHGVAMEGYFWRLSDPASGRVIVALCGVHRGRAGKTWANVALASHPGGTVAAADVDSAFADPQALGVRAGDGVLDADARGVRVDLGPDARLDLRLDDVRPWSRRSLGGLGIGQVAPVLSQHWHPYVLGARASGTAQVGGEAVDLAGFRVYAEKNWGREGFPEQWWWGQAQCFPEGDTCVAFAGGTVAVAGLTTTASAVAVRLGDRLIRLGDPVLSRARVVARDGSWSLRARGPRYSVEIEATAGPSDAHVLPVPLPASGYSVAGALQHFAGELRLVVRRRGRVQFSGTSPLAGLERGGVEQLKTEIARRRATDQVTAEGAAT